MTLRTAWWRTHGDRGHAMGWLRPLRHGGWSTGAQEVFAADQDPVACTFTVELDELWRTRHVHVDSVSRNALCSLELHCDGAGNWSDDAGALPALTGCVDVDIAATPLTNTYPICRYQDIEVGETRTSPVAWVEVPSLTVRRVDQTYRRTGPGAQPGHEGWEYHDPVHGAFRLIVDSFGLVIEYEGFATRIA